MIMLHLLSNGDDQELLIHNSLKETKEFRSSDPSETVKSQKNVEIRQTPPDFPYTGSIKVTIKDKPIVESREYQINLLSWVFRVFLFHIQRTRRLYEIKMRTREHLMNVELQKYFGIWRSKVVEEKKARSSRKSNGDFPDDQKIQLFVNAIVERQRNNKSSCKLVSGEDLSKKSSASREENNGTPKSESVTASALQRRLISQRKIITQQRMRLVQQNQLIEAMKLRRIAEESEQARRETLTTARQVLNKCRHQTRNNLRQLMKVDSWKVDDPKLPPPTPDFLFRMEARAERRRERLREAREKQQKKLEAQKLQEETTRREDEETQKKLRLEAQRKARQLLQEQRRRQIIEAEKLKTANDLVTRFYRRYLLKNYILTPIVRMTEAGKRHQEIADDHYSLSLLTKTFCIWKKYSRQAIDSKLERCVSICNANILLRFFCEWLSLAKDNIKSYKIAWNFYTSRLRGKYLRLWYAQVLEMRLKSLETLQFVINRYDEKIKLKYFRLWGTYVKISDDVNESDRQKEKWRALVKHVVPNFCPKYRGVIRDD